MAAERVAREAAGHAFGESARSISIDWHLPAEEALDGKQIQRWSERLGQSLVDQRQAEVETLAQGIKPEGPLNVPALMVLGIDGGRVQMKEQDQETKSRWREDKALSITSYLPGDGKDKKPRKLVTTYVATMENAAAFGPMAAVEAYRRGLWQAPVVLNISDAGAWIDPISELQKLVDVRIIDFYHAAERLYEVAQAIQGKDTPQAKALGHELKGWLHEGKVQEVIAWMKGQADRLGPARKTDGPAHPREILRQNLGYFEKHQAHMSYAEYRAKGWPIGSGNVEAGVKGFNKRVKGTDQFCCVPIKTSPPCSNRSVTPRQVGLDPPNGHIIDERSGTSPADSLQPG
ncbi:MAG TPA: hypothetical protein VGM26_18295, partial [Rhizomicrobium sp.]